MTTSGTSFDPSEPFVVRVQKLAQDQAKREGAQVVTLIEQAAPAIGEHGEGTHVNTYA
ncbi:MAG TPA: hypothetical protein VGD37_17595 [Kofleriaceae bacterium]|jgi:hypothetical protein